MPVENRFAAIPDGSGGFLDFKNALAWQGPILPVQVEIPTALAALLQKEGKPVPTPVQGVALIDTGAGVSGIDATVVARLGLQPVGQVTVAGVTGEKLRSKYPATFDFPGTSLPKMSFAELVEAEISNQQVPGSSGPLVALIGRDILHHFVLIYNGVSGAFTLSC